MIWVARKGKRRKKKKKIVGKVKKVVSVWRDKVEKGERLEYKSVYSELRGEEKKGGSGTRRE